MKLSRRIVPGRNVHLATACLAASIDGFLEGRPSIIALAPGSAIVCDIEDWLACRRLTQDSHHNYAREQDTDPTWAHPAIMRQFPCTHKGVDSWRRTALLTLSFEAEEQGLRTLRVPPNGPETAFWEVSASTEAPAK